MPPVTGSCSRTLATTVTSTALAPASPQGSRRLASSSGPCYVSSRKRNRSRSQRRLRGLGSGSEKQQSLGSLSHASTVVARRRLPGGRTKGEKAEKREQHCGGFQLRASTGQLSVLEDLSVLPITKAKYEADHERFVEFPRQHHLAITDVGQVDVTMVEFLDQLFLEGEDVAVGQRVVAAWGWTHPSFTKQGDHRLPRAAKALAGWRKIAPGHTRQPMPWMYCALLVTKLLEIGFLATARALMLMFWAYLRPGEALTLKEADLVRPSRMCRHYAVNLHAQSRGEQSKVGLSDESLLLDMIDVPWYGAELAKMAYTGDNAQLLKVEYPDMKSQFEAAQRAVGFRRVSCVLYQASHGGPSHDRRAGHRSVEEIKRRGRWLSESSLRRYEAHARLQQEENAESPDLLRMAMKAIVDLPELFR